MIQPTKATPTAASFPEQGEYALASVKKVMPYGAFLGLDEYNGAEAFLHISEVSSGWVRNIREYVKEGQKTVVLITRVDLDKRQVDVSLKRVSEADRKRKQEGYKMEKRADKLLERAAHKLKKTLLMARKEVAEPLLRDYPALFDAFEDLALNDTLKTKLPKEWHTALAEVVKAEIKPKQVSIRATFTLQFYGGSGVQTLKQTLQDVVKTGTPQTPLKVHYLGAGQFLLDATAGEYKVAEKALSRVQQLLETATEKQDGEYTFQRQKE